MNPSNNIDYSQFGGTPIEENEQAQSQQPKVDYSQFGGEKVQEPKEKVGKFKSALYGLAEGVLAIPALLQRGVNIYSEGLEKAFHGDEAPKLSEEEANPISALMQTFPESEDQTSRRIRVAGQALPLSAMAGIPGVIAGLVGSQAGQTVREVYGKEGKFDEFGFGEAGAITADLLFGLGTGIGTSLVKGAGKAAAQKAPSIFTNPQTGMQRKIVQHAIQQEKKALTEVIKDFSQKTLKSFENDALALSTNKYSQMTQSNASALQRQAEGMFRNTQLNIISPIAATPEQGGRAIQEAANITFRTEVQAAERQAYGAAREASEGITGTAPKTLEEAKALRADMTRTPPSADEAPVVSFLNKLISQLETTTPASTTPASKLLGANGKPLVAAIQHEATAEPTKVPANNLVKMIQEANQEVNYGSQLRLQSHRLKTIVNTFREEVGDILSTKPEAAALYDEANLLHARNSEVWGTKYMRNVRFAENPESIVTASKKSSNMRNLKQGIQNPAVQGLAERLVIEQITEGGSSSANRTAVNNLAPELSLNARNASENIIQSKDPLTTTGGRAAVVNDILKDAAQSVNTGKRPDRILDLMQTPKGYHIVREALNGTPESRELFKSFQRLFVEDILTSIKDKSGVIDFSKAREIFKNPEMREVVQLIGGDSLVNKFNRLEQSALNFEKNINLYSRPEVQSLFKTVFNEVKSSAFLGAMMHALHVPWPVIAGLGVVKTGASVTKLTYNALQKKILSNPKALHYLEQLSEAKTYEQLAKQLPRLANELEKSKD